MALKKFWKKIVAGNEDRPETEFLPAVLEVTETPPSPVGRLVMWTVMALLVIGLLWSIFGRVDEVAVATGKIIPVGQVKTVQVEDKGIVKAILVREGDYVKKGQLLVELDPTSTGADLDRLKKQAAYYRLDIERLTAELNETPFEAKPSPDLEAKDINAQNALYRSRVSQYRAQVAAANMAVAQNQAAVNSALADREKYASMLKISSDKERRLRDLVQQGAVSLFQLLDQTSNRIDLQQSLKAQDEQILKARATLAESQENLATTIATYRKEVMTEMVDARKQLNSYDEELKKAAEKNRLSRVVAPVDGRVSQLSIHTVGGIVTEAQALMLIVPEDVKLEVEAWADNKDIGFIRVGQRAEVKVETFDFQKYGVVDGVVDEISPDANMDSSDKEKYKKYRVALSMAKKDMTVGFAHVPLSPGMAVTAEIKIRQKRIIEFFLDPFRKYMSESLRER